jgi:hypothetical protein
LLEAFARLSCVPLDAECAFASCQAQQLLARSQLQQAQKNVLNWLLGLPSFCTRNGRRADEPLRYDNLGVARRSKVKKHIFQVQAMD